MIPFGDRVGAIDLAPLTTVKVTTDSACMDIVYKFAEEAGIDIIRD